MTFLNSRFLSFLACCCLALPAASAIAQSDGEELTAKVVKDDLKIEIEIPGVFVAEDKEEVSIEPRQYKGELIVTKITQEGLTIKKGDVLMEFDLSLIHI